MNKDADAIRDFAALRELLLKSSHPDTIREVESAPIARVDAALSAELPAVALSYADIASTMQA
jgi:hypothetical protein